jgi:hypothetical protein
MNRLTPIEIHNRPWLSMTCELAKALVDLSMGFLVALGTKSHQILGSVIAQSAPWQNVMDLKIFHPPAPLASPAISLQNCTA